MTVYVGGEVPLQMDGSVVLQISVIISRHMGGGSKLVVNMLCG